MDISTAAHHAAALTEQLCWSVKPGRPRPDAADSIKSVRGSYCLTVLAFAAQAKTHEKVDSLGENRSIACHAVVMLIRS